MQALFGLPLCLPTALTLPLNSQDIGTSGWQLVDKATLLAPVGEGGDPMSLPAKGFRNIVAVTDQAAIRRLTKKSQESHTNSVAENPTSRSPIASSAGIENITRHRRFEKSCVCGRASIASMWPLMRP
jgi:hypothetical protein